MDTQTEATEETSSPEVETETVEAPAAEPEQLTPVERPSRADRKRQRIDVEAATREKEEIKQRLAAAELREQQRAQEIAELRGRMEERQRQTQTTDKHAETKSKIAELRKQAKAHLYFSSQAKSPEAAEKEWDRYQELLDEADDLRDNIRAEGRWEKQRGELSSQIPDPAMQREAAVITARFPWLASNRKAQQIADAHINDIMATTGRPYSMEMGIEAVAWAGKVLGIGGHQAPTNGQRALYGGVSGGEGSGGGESRPRTPPRTIGNEKLAQAAYRHLDAKAAWKAWTRDMAEASEGNDDE